ncbi:3',5'-nucleoside bisphosphate phosphatase [Hydrogenophaga sp.]|uniref:3',5'-nucleoside bisphosphate phosphatase n=1 Tax=Hydrogenophaga sp. TaxID=1904254 RepID=UPI0025B83574|nr:3',5'-nucleoside bisphosphate phosphatase [Hydrogenophaga sp.]MDO9135577.1 3',5'-nucleoside bisphosphate phosphatase [Hydrogenophaga sp.]MDO9504792.1 3',5'-nucleoside bisphosphate phosphatase [Hydrogenophaga sp.]MDP2987071.1 3',5'-nucleoside bisphosphate phosphatase [Hydrogenophaga sp.]MDP3348393.1 3',5'-nucleoside bisphosphate phosphatase [Hydrogenophaga sp.]MDP3627429.1 3',5'-nucleoside bisphosphate phosphatase [Hydrogenophaga sp.]
MNTLTNADLHCHSVVSDGTLTPEALAQRARANGVELWALTDHDELGGQDRAMAAAHEVGMSYLTGVEISVSFLNITVHIVGLGMDHTHPALLAGLRATRGGREQRARDMSDDLARVGIKGVYEGALKYVGNPELISRSHFARYLVEIGVSKDTNDVFRKYITEGKPGFVPHRWAKLADAVGWITQAGGVAVIAHPGRYKLTPNEEFALFTEFKSHGGQGVEVMTGAHNQADYVKYAGYCQEFGLVASRGSDFHSPEESHMDLGKLPDLPGSVTPVWELLQSRIH